MHLSPHCSDCACKRSQTSILKQGLVKADAVYVYNARPTMSVDEGEGADLVEGIS
jgi:hypothetical protein